jgi:hypothetical protein
MELEPDDSEENVTLPAVTAKEEAAFASDLSEEKGFIGEVLEWIWG